jgi:hypothetical protein
MSAHLRQQRISPIIHGVNVMALLLGGVILVMTAVVRPYQLIILVPVLGLLAMYWRLRTNPGVAAGFFGLAMALFGWILLCEHIVTVDNVVGTQITRHLVLGARLQTYVLKNLDTGDLVETEPCCGDSLTWRYRPGSRYRLTFDCPTCNKPHDGMVDETGYLNEPRGLMERHQQIDLFLAGDSVMQGLGVPSVVELLRPRIPLRMWNLSVAGYGPRQKVNALLTYALPKRPRWLIVEFYAGNDLVDAIADDVCAGGGELGCRYQETRNELETVRRLAHHPIYHAIFDVPTGIWTKFADYSAENFTLATTRYLLDRMKAAIKQGTAALINRPPSRNAAGKIYDAYDRQEPSSPAPVRQGQWPSYLRAGMTAVQREYERLSAVLARMDPRPTVILLYNPAGFEVYRGLWFDRRRGMQWIESPPHTDSTSAFQREALRTFARTQGWRFLDLTEPLHREVQARQVWLYGRYYTGHWSPQGTAIVADVLAAELLRAMAAMDSHGHSSSTASIGR